MKRTVALLAVTAGAVATAMWLAPASVHVVSWNDDGPARIGLLPPLERLWIDLAEAALAIGTACWMIWRRGGAAAVRRLSTELAPFNLLWLWAVPFAPWLPDRAPLLLLLAGPLRWVILALAVLGAAWVWGVARWSALPRWLPGRHTVFAASLLLYLCAGVPWGRQVGPGADEPHYLVITQSLLLDHDLQIENNHQRRDYRAYFGGELRPDYLQRGLGEVIYSVHAPGLPALLVAPFAVAGYLGTLVFMCVIAALAALAIFDLAALVGGESVALVTWLATCMTVPFVPHAWLIFPEMPAALLTAWGVVWLLAPLPVRRSAWLWRGVAFALFPWLHTKYAVLLAALTAALLWRLRTRWRDALALVIPIGISVLLWLWSFYVMYGVFDPEAPYGAYPRIYVKWANVPRGLLGLAFDQKFGLLVYAPVYLFAVLGAWRMLSSARLRLIGVTAVATTAGFVLSTTRLYMWWGGSSAPARFLVPVAPLLAAMIAAALTGLRSAVGRATFAACLVCSVVISSVAMTFPAEMLFFSNPHGVSRLVAAMQESLPLTSMLPTFTEGPVRAPLVQMLPWLAAWALAFIATTFVARRTSPPRLFWSAATVVVVFGATVALAAHEFPPAERHATARAGHGDLLVALDAGRLRAFDYPARRRMSEAALARVWTLEFDRSSFGDNPAQLVGPLTLPPGRYDVRVWFRGAETGQGRVAVRFGRKALLAEAAGDLASPAVLPLTLPITIPGLFVGVSDAALASGIDRIEIEPWQIVARSDRTDVDVMAIEPIASRRGALILYTDESTYPEGGVFWTRGTEEGTIEVAPAGASRIVLTLHVGPNGGAVRVTAGGQDYSAVFAPNDTREIAVPVPPGARTVPVRVGAARQFRSVDTDPASDDTRRLGCQVRVDVR